MELFALTNKSVSCIDKDEMMNLTILAQNGDVDARNKLILYSLESMVYNVVYGPRSLFKNFAEKEELISEAILALYDALDNFDPSYNVKFTTYAYYHVFGKIIDYIRKYNIRAKNISINQMIEDNSILNYSNYLAGTIIQDNSFIDDAEDKRFLLDIKKEISSLDKREQEFLLYVYGYIDGEYHGINQTGRNLGFSKQYVSMTLQSGIKKIKKKINKSI